jgi:hypothetical protein
MARPRVILDQVSAVSQADLDEALALKADVTRVYQTTSTATLTLNVDSYDMAKLTAQAEALLIDNTAGTPTEGQPLIIEILATGAHVITYGNQFKAVGVPLPSITVANKLLALAMYRDVVRSFWNVIGVNQQA